jgi:hypothetical protein
LGGGRKTADAEQPRMTTHKTWETESSIGDSAWKLRWKGNDTKTGVMELNEQGEGDVGVEDETAVQLNKQGEDCNAIVDEVMAVDRVVTESSIRKLARGWSPTT